jgi:hypothetical protein
VFVAGIEIGLGIIAAFVLLGIFDAIVGAALGAHQGRMAKHGPIQRKTVVAWAISCAIILGVPAVLSLFAR